MSQHYDRETGELWDDEDGPAAVPVPPEVAEEAQRIAERVDPTVTTPAALHGAFVGEPQSVWDERAAEARALEAANDATLMQLAARYKVGLPMDQLIRLHLAVLVEHVLGDQTQPRRIEYDIECATKLRDMLANTEADVARSKLLEGVRLDVRPPNANGRG